MKVDGVDRSPLVQLFNQCATVDDLVIPVGVKMVVKAHKASNEGEMRHLLLETQWKAWLG